MRKSRTLSKIRSGNCARACGLGHYLPFFVRYAAHFNYDVIWLDLEHRAMDDREVQSLLAMSHQHGIDCMVRPQTRQRTRLYRYLEDGASGFMFPFVESAAEARELVGILKYPPMGNRGIDGAGRDADFGIAAWARNSSYLEDANRETFIAAQIETVGALADAEAIAAVPGIDVLFVGPADLGARLSASGGVELDRAIEQVASAACNCGKAWGIPAGTPELVAKYREMGAQLLAHGGEFIGVMRMLEQCGSELDKILGCT